MMLLLFRAKIVSEPWRAERLPGVLPCLKANLNMRTGRHDEVVLHIDSLKTGGAGGSRSCWPDGWRRRAGGPRVTRHGIPRFLSGPAGVNGPSNR